MVAQPSGSSRSKLPLTQEQALKDNPYPVLNAAVGRVAEAQPQVDPESLPAHESIAVSALVHGRVLLALPDEEPAALLVGFHGYAERAEDALAALLRVAAGRPWAVAAPQALHPFYRSKDGKVGACWMTSQDRELALRENVAYANAAVAELRARVPGARLAILGFSQGVAMAYRTAARCGQKVDAMVALAGDVPPELRNGGWGTRPAVLIGRGDGEQWYTEEKMADDMATLQRLGIEHEVARFTGGHDWDETFVARTGEFLAARLGGTR